jgi:hypothetical protein
LQTFNTWVISKVCIIVSNFNDAIIVKMAVGNVSDLASERKLPAQVLRDNRCQMAPVILWRTSWVCRVSYSGHYKCDIGVAALRYTRMLVTNRLIVTSPTAYVLIT